jgi:hypothetical protein
LNKGEERFKKEDLKKQFEDLYKKLALIVLWGEDISYLSGDGKNKYHEFIAHSPFLVRLAWGAMGIFALDLCSFLGVFKKNKENNISSFLGRLLADYHHSDWKNDISIEELKSHQKAIEKIKSSKSIETIIHFRSKIFAHKDKDSLDTDLESYHSEVMTQVELLNKEFQEIGEKLFEESYTINFPYWDEDRNLLRMLSQYFEVVELINEAKYERGKSTITIEELERRMDEWGKSS